MGFLSRIHMSSFSHWTLAFQKDSIIAISWSSLWLSTWLLWKGCLPACLNPAKKPIPAITQQVISSCFPVVAGLTTGGRCVLPLWSKSKATGLGCSVLQGLRAIKVCQDGCRFLCRLVGDIPKVLSKKGMPKTLGRTFLMCRAGGSTHI